MTELPESYRFCFNRWTVSGTRRILCHMIVHMQVVRYNVVDCGCRVCYIAFQLEKSEFDKNEEIL